MSFKNLILLLCLTSLSACSWMRDQPKDGDSSKPGQNSAFKSESLNLDCLKVMPKQLQYLFNGQYTTSNADQDQVRQIWGCLDKSLYVFGTRVKGKNSGAYSALELRRFANKYLPAENQFTPELTDSIFRLKKAVLGGSDSLITTGDQSDKDVSEIKRLRQKLNRFGEIILPLAPYIPVLLTSPSDGSNQRLLASQSLNRFIMDFALILEDSQNSLLWSDLGAFIHEVELYTQKGSPSALTVIREQIPLYQYVKLLLVGGNETLIETSKWKPIFSSISSFYNAIYVASKPNQQLDQLKIEIQSSESDQRKATEKITSLLLSMKANKTLYSKKSVETVADGWAKVLLINAFLFPKSQGSLSLKTFLDSDDLKRYAGYMIDEIIELSKNPNDVGLIQSMTYHLNSLIKGSADQDLSPNGQVGALSVSSIQEYTTQLKPMFLDPSQVELVRAGMEAIKNLSAILIGRNSDRLSHIDLENLIQKLSDLYVTWAMDTKKKQNFPELIGQTFDIVLRAPYTPYAVTLTQINATIDSIQKVTQVLSPSTKIDWNLYRDRIKSAFKLKNLLYGKADNTIYSAQLKEFQKDLEPFRNVEDFTGSFTELSYFLNTNLFAEEMDLNKLLEEVDSFLPEKKKITTYGFSYEQIGLIKAIVIGGSATKISKTEYSEMARIASSVSKNIIPLFNALPEKFKVGLNSQTIGLAEGAFRAFAEGKKEDIRTSDLESFLYQMMKNSGIKITHESLFTTIKGVNQRVLTVDPEQRKAKKVTEIPLKISAKGFKTFVTVLEQMKLSFIDVENAFKGQDPKVSVAREVLEQRLLRSENKEMLAHIQPIIDGTTGKPHLEARGKRNNQYFFDDLMYKSMIYNVLDWAFRAYQIEEGGINTADLPRLNYNETVDVLTDINDLIYDLGFAFTKGTAVEAATKRMQTINLFMQNGNGDGYVDLYETTEFLTMSLTGKLILDDARKGLAETCLPKVALWAGIEKFTYKCLNRSFFSDDFIQKIYSSVAPQVVEHYVSLSPSDKDTFRRSILTAADSKWKDDGSIDLDNLETVVSIPYYMENIFERMDTNYNGILEFSEAMKAFPVFCGEIKKAGGSDIRGECGPGQDPREVEAVFGHLLLYGTPPDVSGNKVQKTIKGLQFRNWAKGWISDLRYTRDEDFRPLNRKDLLSIISNLSTSISPVAETPSPDSPGREGDDSLRLAPPVGAQPGSP